jgi:hypothetical protein
MSKVSRLQVQYGGVLRTSLCARVRVRGEQNKAREEGVRVEQNEAREEGAREGEGEGEGEPERYSVRSSAVQVGAVIVCTTFRPPRRHRLKCASKKGRGCGRNGSWIIADLPCILVQYR